jgi:hypothetical protein
MGRHQTNAAKQGARRATGNDRHVLNGASGCCDPEHLGATYGADWQDRGGIACVGGIQAQDRSNRGKIRKSYLSIDG